MNEKDLDRFLEKNLFFSCPIHSVAEEGMSSKVDAFKSEGILLRIVVDRGQKFIDLAQVEEGGKWSDVFTLAKKVDSEFQLKKGSFSEAIEVLTKYWPKIKRKLETDKK